LPVPRQWITGQYVGSIARCILYGQAHTAKPQHGNIGTILTEFAIKHDFSPFNRNIRDISAVYTLFSDRASYLIQA
jgi:hypothetical protein